MLAAASRSLLRSPSLRAASARIGAPRPPLRSCPTLTAAGNASRFTRCPIRTSFCVESLLPMHSATASSLMTSMLAISRRGYGWLSEAGNDDL